MSEAEHIWRAKTDEDVVEASHRLADYTEEDERIIRDELTRRSLPEPPRWIQVRSCVSLEEAVFLRSVLEGSGIACWLPDEHPAVLRPTLAISGVRVLVPATQAGRAVQVLTEAAEGTRSTHR